MMLKRSRSVNADEPDEETLLSDSVRTALLLNRFYDPALPKARLKKYRKFLHVPMKDCVGPIAGERLSTEGKGLFPGPVNELKDITEAFAGPAASLDRMI